MKVTTAVLAAITVLAACVEASPTPHHNRMIWRWVNRRWCLKDCTLGVGNCPEQYGTFVS
jgi:hypothetical protein